eukprot:SAG25_NODE_532_length_7148_cov_7.572847_7_plen_170_part_00
MLTSRKTTSLRTHDISISSHSRSSWDLGVTENIAFRVLPVHQLLALGQLDRGQAIQSLEHIFGIETVHDDHAMKGGFGPVGGRTSGRVSMQSHTRGINAPLNDKQGALHAHQILQRGWSGWPVAAPKFGRQQRTHSVPFDRLYMTTCDAVAMTLVTLLSSFLHTFRFML